MRVRRISQGWEKLEHRRVLAGNVVAEIVAGSLTVLGDDQDNAILVSQTQAGRFVITGLDGTTVNGVADPVELGRVSRDSRFQMSGGSDRIEFGSSPDESFRVARQLLIDGGTGFNSVVAFAALNVRRDVTINNPEGGTTNLHGQLLVGSHLLVNNGDDNSTTNIEPWTSATNAIGGNVQISNGQGSHYNYIGGTRVSGNVSVENEGGPESFTFNYFDKAGSNRNVLVGGDLVFRVLAGGATNGIFGANITGDVQLEHGTGDSIHQVGDSLIAGSISIESRGTLLTSVVDSVMQQLLINSDEFADQVEITNVAIRRGTTLRTGTGDDLVTIDDAIFGGDFVVELGQDSDQLLIETSSDAELSGPTKLLGRADVDLGTGNDLLRLGSFAERARKVRLLGQAQFNGGDGDDTLDAANVESRRTVDFLQFENMVPLPPFRPSGRYQVGEYVVETITADLNADDAPDIVTVNADSETVSVLINRGNGKFRSATHYDAGPSPFDVVAADFNGDGRPDLAVANNVGDGSVSLLLNRGNGRFERAREFEIGTAVAIAAITASDLNGDGAIDVATANRTGNNEASISVLLGDGEGQLTLAQTYELGQINWGNDITAGDLNGDGNIDLLGSALRGLAILTNNGDGTFASRVEQRSVLVGVSLADLNQDGFLDLITEANGLAVQLGNGDGTFGPEIQILEEGTSGVAVEDFNGDSFADIAVAHFPEMGSIFLGKGDGTFTAARPFSVGSDDGPLVAADLNGDGWLDLVVGNQESESVTVLRNRRRWSE